MPGEYEQGQVCYWAPNPDPLINGDGELHVILENLVIGSQIEVTDLISKGKVSGPMTYSPWVVGNAYQETTGGGAYAPQIVEYDYSPDEFKPDYTPTIPLNKRPGAFVWVVSDNFTLQPATNNITGAQPSFLGTPITPQELIAGSTYSAGSWVYTPQVGSGPSPIADPYFNYVDITKGVVNKYAYVVSTFTYNSDGQTTSVYFDELVEQSILREVVVQVAENGQLPIYKYKPRFPVGTYLEYRSEVSASPEYYIAANFFTPDSTNAQDLVNEGLIFPLYINATQRSQFLDYLVGGTPGQIQTISILTPGSGYLDGNYSFVPLEGKNGKGAIATIVVSSGAVTTVTITNPGRNYQTGDVLTINRSFLGGSGSGASLRVTSVIPLATTPPRVPTRMFRFFKGDRTFFRQGSQVISYTATSNVHPLFEFYIYLANGIFVETERYLPSQFESQQYIPYFDPAYVSYSEDTVLAEDGRNIYRVMRAFTPNSTVTNWTNTTVINTARIEEYEKNLLRYVDKYSCEEDILSQLGKDISAIKLGICQVTLIPKNKGRFSNNMERKVYVWENAATFSEVPQLSWYSGTTYAYTPPNYRDGTMRL